MMISQTAEYALRAVVWLASHPDQAIGTPRISEAAQVPPGYLAKVLQMLARAGLVTSTPGRRGGFQLTREPGAISVLDVVDAVDPIGRITTCPLGLASHRGKLCPLHRRLDEAMAEVERAFAGSTIAELIAGEGEPLPLCEHRGEQPGTLTDIAVRPTSVPGGIAPTAPTAAPGRAASKGVDKGAGTRRSGRRKTRGPGGAVGG